MILLAQVVHASVAPSSYHPRQVLVIQEFRRACVKIPWVQYNDRIVVVSVLMQRQAHVSQPCRTPWRSTQVQHVEEIVVVPVVTQQSSTSILTVQKTVLVLQTHYLDRVAYVPAVARRQVPTIQTAHKMVDISQSFSALTEW